MPMIPLEIDGSTLIITSVISGVVTFAFCRAIDMSSSNAALVAAAVGIILYAIGVLPVGLLVTIGIFMLIGIGKAMFSKNRPPE